ncbi:apolipoprotein N-acyltransferase [Polaromonas naphthalenivorans]|uniref:apolipoprotein N-acyltransferase n=1 Tax=Polaromonas naphthalenivorans TaxID=216465 RepID=UPI000674BDE3
MRSSSPVRFGSAGLKRPTQPPRNRLAWLQFAIVLVAGCTHAASMAWPFPLGSVLGLVQGQPVGWLQLLALALLAGQLDGARSWRRGAWLGGLFAVAMQCATFWWLFISLHVYGGLAAPLAVLSIVLLAAFLGLYYAAACGLFVAFAPVQAAWRALFFAAAWLLAELARVKFFTGFPWGEGGYAHVDGWARPLAAWAGVHGLTFIAALVAAWLAFCLLAPKTRWRAALAGVALSVTVAWLPVYNVGDVEPDPQLAKPMSVTLLQGNIPQDEKFVGGTGVVTALRWYGEQLHGAKGALVVAPETALPLLPQQLPDGYWQALQARFTTGDQAALIGLPLGDYDTGYSNSVIGLKPVPPGQPASLAQPEPYRYDKHHLVPFGEVIPPGFHWFIKLMNIPLGDFNRGAVGQPSFGWQGQRLAPNICYEDLFGEELGARFVDAAQAPTMFVNISNIGWFGNTVAIDQHLQISRMRSLEFGRPMIRATNTGATVIINYRGEVTHSLPRHTRGVLTGEVQGRSGITPYAWWAGRFGLWPLWGLSLAVTGLAFLGRRR